MTHTAARKIDGLKEIEEVNEMDKGDILRLIWINPITRCSPSQICSHLILPLSSKIPDNKALLDGLCICHKKVYAEK